MSEQTLKHLFLLLGLSIRELWVRPGLLPLDWVGPVDAPGRDGEEAGEEEAGPQDVDGLGELLDGVAPHQPHHSEQNYDNLVELLSSALTNKVHMDRDPLDGIKHLYWLIGLSLVWKEV